MVRKSFMEMLIFSRVKLQTYHRPVLITNTYTTKTTTENTQKSLFWETKAMAEKREK